MKLRTLLLASLVFFTALLQGCSKPEADSAKGPQAPSLEVIAAKARGFTAGPVMAANTVYVFFDPQCPHCGQLWRSSVPLQKQVKFVWIPIGWMGAISIAQGAAILGDADPVARMNAHETALAAGSGGTSGSSDIPDDVRAAIQTNTELLRSFGVESVPFIVAKNQRTQQLVSNEGAMDTAPLAGFLGVDAP